MTYEEAQRLPQAELTARVLAQLGTTVVEVERPRPGQLDDLRLATKPVPSSLGMCETQFIDVAFSREEKRPDDVQAGRTERVSMSRAFHVVGDLNPLTGIKALLASGKAHFAAACAGQSKVLRFFIAPNDELAWVAARAVERIGKQATDKGVPISCGGAACSTAQLANLSTISPLQITGVEGRTCPGSTSGSTMCLQVSLLNGPRRGDMTGTPGMVQRDGWDLEIDVRDPMIGTDVVTYNNFVLERIRANQTSMSGPDGLVP